MTRKIIINWGMVFISVVLIACVSTAEFKSLDVNKTGEQQILRGKLTKPTGDGPFPAIVLLHGCDGPQDFYSAWISRFRRWGFVTLMVNSFGPRGESNLCDPGREWLISPYHRAMDAYGAKLYLDSLPFVDRNRIAVMGWSHGGRSTLQAVQYNHLFSDPFQAAKVFSDPFQAAIAFYPWCEPLSDINAPLLVLIGEKDDWNPAYRCQAYILPEESEQEIILKVYPDAYHSFDLPFRIEIYKGHMVGRNSSAAIDAYDRVRTFLEKYLMDH